MAKLQIVTELATSDPCGLGSAPPVSRKSSDIGKLARGSYCFVKLLFKVNISPVMTDVVIVPNDADIEPKIGTGPVNLGRGRRCYRFLKRFGSPHGDTNSRQCNCAKDCAIQMDPGVIILFHPLS